MTKPALTDADVQAILKLLSAAEHLNEFRLRSGDIEIAYTRHAGATANLLPATGFAPGATTATTPAGPGPAQETAASTPGPRATGASSATAPGAVDAAAPASPRATAILPGAQVTSPMFGTFYRAPAPGAAPFVEVGQAVEADTVVCIIEVMKLMNSITAGARGTVRQILVSDSQPVDLGQPLIVIEPAA